jgi:hypothetical protein
VTGARASACGACVRRAGLARAEKSLGAGRQECLRHVGSHRPGVRSQNENDVNGRPSRKDFRRCVYSRADADLSTSVAGVALRIPIVAANMSSVTEETMGIAMGQLGGLGIIHRMCSVERQLSMVKAVHEAGCQVGFSIGVGPDWRDRMEACRGFASIVCLDVAHGHHLRVSRLLDEYFRTYRDYPIIIGQIATSEAAGMFIEGIPDEYHRSVAFKASIGGGSLCTTRIMTGFSFQLPGLIPSPFRRTAFSRFHLCAPATPRSIGGGAGGFACHGFDFAIGRRNRLPHQFRRTLQATFSRNSTLPAFSRQSFSGNSCIVPRGRSGRLPLAIRHV